MGNYYHFSHSPFLEKNMEPIDFRSLKQLELNIMCLVDWFAFRKLLANQNKKWQEKCWESFGFEIWGCLHAPACKKPFGEVVVVAVDD